VYRGVLYVYSTAGFKTWASVSVNEILGHLQHRVDTFDSEYMITRVIRFGIKRGSSGGNAHDSPRWFTSICFFYT
jgi:hypothetical protein